MTQPVKPWSPDPTAPHAPSPAPAAKPERTSPPKETTIITHPLHPTGFVTNYPKPAKRNFPKQPANSVPAAPKVAPQKVAKKSPAPAKKPWFVV